MSFKILLNEKLKDKRIRDLYNFINSFQSVDWGIFYYGFALKQKDIEEGPKCGGIPTNYGCILFPSFNYDETKFIGHAEGYLPKTKIVDLKKKLEEDKFVDIQCELDRDVIASVASEHPDVVDSVTIELILPAIVKTDAIPRNIEGALRLFQRQSKRMKNLVDFCRDIPPPFLDVEVHQWNLEYAEPKEVEEAIKYVGKEEVEEEAFPVDYLFDEVIAELEEEPEEKGYIIILRADHDAKQRLRDVEKKMDEALSPIKRYISKKTCFVTLVL